MTRDGRLVLSVTEAAGMLGISRGLAYELVARGELPSLRLGVPLTDVGDAVRVHQREDLRL